jgi:hypothetical protein
MDLENLAAIPFSGHEQLCEHHSYSFSVRLEYGSSDTKHGQLLRLVLLFHHQKCLLVVCG